jgi:putative thiamine transport system ATP-binding protein
VSGLALTGVEIAWAASGRVLVPALDLDVAPGETATVMGPSGSGKSTLLAFVGGFLERGAFRARGRIAIDGADVSELAPERRRIGILFQDDLLFPHLSVGDNLLFGLPPAAARDRAARRAAITAALEQAGLAGFAERDPATLSGGQRARVALLRTLLAEPHALLLDEPFSKLDAALRAEFRAFVFRHARERRLPTLLATHDIADAEAAGGPRVTLAAPAP